MNDLQRRLWCDMTSALQQFESLEIPLSEMVGRMESALDAGQFSESLRNAFYDHWMHLEIWSATRGDQMRPDELSRELAEMRSFLTVHKDPETI